MSVDVAKQHVLERGSSTASSCSRSRRARLSDAGGKACFITRFTITNNCKCHEQHERNKRGEAHDE